MSIGQANPRIKLDLVNVLVADRNPQSVDIVASALTGFGVRSIERCTRGEEALRAVSSQVFDFVIADMNLDGIDGLEFIRLLRRAQDQKTAFMPVVLTMGHARPTQVHKARDSGANFVVTKPIAPKVLLERIFWVAREERPFIETKNYLGPERRFKREGPPIGKPGRRRGDLHEELGAASTPNLSQDQIDGLMKPQRATLF